MAERVAERLRVAVWDFDGPDVDRSLWYAMTLILIGAEGEAAQTRKAYQDNMQRR